MIDLAATIAAMKEAGMADDVILVALSCVKVEAQNASVIAPRTARQERNRRYYEKRLKASENDAENETLQSSEKRLNASNSDGGVLYNNKSKSSSSDNTPQRHLVTVLDTEHAVAVIEHRQRLRKPLTSHAARLLAGKFAKCADPNAAADAMIANGWLGFEPEWMDRQARLSRTKEPTLSAAFGQLARNMEPQDDATHHPKPSGIVVLDVPFRPGR